MVSPDYEYNLYQEHVIFPTALDQFAYLGFPGCIGSMDVVHVHWGMCPITMSVLCTGKEGFPTLAYQVIVDHFGRAIACTAGFYGSLNDKTIVKFDGQITKLPQGSHSATRYRLHRADGSEIVRNGVWVMVDGGYLEWVVTMAASKDDADEVYVAWRSKWESVRKDIECFFGRMKKRFRILKMAIELHKKHQVDNVFLTCVTLMNMLHLYDGLGDKELDGDIEGADEKYWSVKPHTDRSQFADFRAEEEIDRYYCEEEGGVAATDEHLSEKQRYLALEADLLGHFHYLMKNNEHKRWLRS